LFVVSRYNDLNMADTSKPFVMVIFGASGDLTRRKLVPALFDLYKAGLLPQRFTILGYARRDWSKDQFVAEVSGGLGEATQQHTEFFEHFEYQRGDFDVPEDYEGLARRMDSLNDELGQCGHRLFYFATPAESYQTILQGLKKVGLEKPCSDDGWTRLVVEKPFGHNLESARHLDGELRKIFEEEQIYRIDHYLAKETVQNILAFRFANSIFESLWSAEHIERIEIVVAEQDAIGTRGGFYDKTGAIRDVLQNHILQLLAITTMDAPETANAEEFRQQRAELLADIKTGELNKDLVLGQYSGYHEVDKVDPQSTTETFVLLKAMVDRPRWQGMPIYLATGKALSATKAAITVYFKKPVNKLFDHHESGKNYNVLTFHLQPNPSTGIQLLAKKPGYKTEVKPVNMEVSYDESFASKGVDAYSRLIVDIINGDQTLFTRSDEVEAEWSFIDPIVEAIQKNGTKPDSYDPGSRGPDRAQRTLRSL
jgi:glucose-6-phosphate 1-dehydrogenase